jgi:uncharacterized protein
VAGYEKPLPQPTPLTQPFWDAARRGELRIQRCDECGRYRFYPTAVCAACGSPAATWTKMSGRGKVFSWIVVRRAIEAAWRDAVPFTVAVVELDEQRGLLVPGTLTGIAPEKVVAGMPVEVWFEPVTEEVSLTRWRPAAG